MAVWVSPKGKVYDFPESHAMAVAGHPALFGLTPEQVKKDYYSIEDVVVEKGWVRIGVETGWKHINVIVKKDGSVDLDLARLAIVELGLHEHNGDAIIHITRSNQASILKNIKMRDFLKSEDVFENFDDLCESVSEVIWGNAYWYNWKTGVFIAVPKSSTHAMYLEANSEVFGFSIDDKVHDLYRDPSLLLTVMDRGWAMIHVYGSSFQVNMKEMSKQKMNDIVYDMVQKVKVAKDIAIAINTEKDTYDYGWTNEIEFR